MNLIKLVQQKNVEVDLSPKEVERIFLEALDELCGGKFTFLEDDEIFTRSGRYEPGYLLQKFPYSKIVMKAAIRLRRDLQDDSEYHSWVY